MRIDHDHVCCGCLKMHLQAERDQLYKHKAWEAVRYSGKLHEWRNYTIARYGTLQRAVRIASDIALSFHQLQRPASEMFTRYGWGFFMDRAPRTAPDGTIEDGVIQGRFDSMREDARRVRDRFVKHVISLLDGPLMDFLLKLQQAEAAGQVEWSAVSRLMWLMIDTEDVLAKIRLDDLEDDIMSENYE